MKTVVFFAVVAVIISLMACGTSLTNQDVSWKYSLDEYTEGTISFNVPRNWDLNHEDDIIGIDPGVWALTLMRDKSDIIHFAGARPFPLAWFGPSPDSLVSYMLHNDFEKQIARTIDPEVMYDVKYSSGPINGKVATFLTGTSDSEGDKVTGQMAYISNGDYVWIVNCAALANDQKMIDACGHMINSTKFLE